MKPRNPCRSGCRSALTLVALVGALALVPSALACSDSRYRRADAAARRDFTHALESYQRGLDTSASDWAIMAWQEIVSWVPCLPRLRESRTHMLRAYVSLRLMIYARTRNDLASIRIYNNRVSRELALASRALASA
jgi:hypothetical protein